MRRDVTSWYSHNLNMDMPLVAYGHAGYPLLMFPTAAAAQTPTDVVRLQIGQEYLIDAHDVSSYSTSGPEGLEYREQPPVLVAIFTTAGTFTVFLIYDDGRERRLRFVVG